MDLETAKACVINALLIALADRQFHPMEKRLLMRFIAEAGVDDATARAWSDEVRQGNIGFRTVTDSEAALAVLKLALGMAGADGTFGPEERTAVIALGKAVGVDRHGLDAVLKQVVGRDVIATIFPPLESLDAPTVLLTDHFERLQEMRDACRGVPLDVRPLAELRATLGAQAVVFHAAPERSTTLEVLEQIKRVAPDAHWIGVIDRHQAPQVSYLLDAGAHRCLVEQVYPDELAALLAELKRSR